MAELRSGIAQTVRGNRDIVAILLVGVVLRVWQYLANMSMWFDELSIARNITERSLPQLLSQPLAYTQTAPLGFLGVIDISSTVFGPGDMSLRLFPFLCGIAGLFLFWRVAQRTLTGVAVPFAVALFAISPPLLRYSAELKQYGPDVVVILGLTLVTLNLCERAPTVRRCFIAGGIGALAVLFSQSAVLVLAGFGAALTLRWALRWDDDVDTRTPVLVTVPIWACAALAGLLVAQRFMTPQTMSFMHVFWRSRAGFLPLPPTVGGSLLWARDRFAQFFGVMSGFPIPFVFTALALAGFLVIGRRRRTVALILLGPVAVTFAAAVAQQYPFRTRLVLFLLPTILLTTAASIGWIADRASVAYRPAGPLLALAAMIPPLMAIMKAPPPYAVEGFKPVLAYVQAHRQSGDKIYVFSNSFQAIARYGLQYGMSESSYVNGVCDEHSNTPFLVDVDRFRGEPRVWVIASSVPDWLPARRAIGKYLATIGVRRDSIGAPALAPISPVTAELYDLSDTARLRMASARDFSAPVDTLHPLCFDWVRPTVVSSAESPR